MFTGLLYSKSNPHCQCLYEIENKLPRTIHCFVACQDQFQILREREEAAKSKKRDDEQGKEDKEVSSL